MEKNVGFIGLGAMGSPMAFNVRKNMPPDATLFIYDVLVDPAERLKAACETLGPVKIAKSPREVAENALTIISIVPAAQHVKAVYLDADSGVTAAKDATDVPTNSRRIYLECSTIDIATATSVGNSLKQAGMGTYVDSPVSGGVPAAERGALSFLLGLDSNSKDRSSSDRVLSTAHYMGSPSKIFHCGGLGKGLAAKLCNNYLSCTFLLANSEAMATGLRLGLDKHVLHKVIHESTGQNFMLDHVCPVPDVVPHAPSSNNYKLGFKAEMLVKDVGLAVDAANSVGIKPTIGEAAMNVYRQVAVDEEYQGRDGSIVYKFLGGPDN
ncbi:hypothetical protein JX266_010024 [Neoarthrinium moseri]|uniref:uncharacterized protein n=1 Tax=Neoarthrinium moseri TaxID=1658444 RepID=UPI001FDAE7D3|nr:uncharacterized protein JN550_004669 [Neoarthrinium moseri]KAI1843765.1 hypothetical protein JX266_010024 [Neoarthrinium moseri]KAI1871224.1 hypothetical protein JN550_004669 [Neoarthrinium moseri]